MRALRGRVVRAVETAKTAELGNHAVKGFPVLCVPGPILRNFSGGTILKVYV